MIYEHLSVVSNCLEISGEHIISDQNALDVKPDFFGADEAITNYARDRQNWVATLIVVERSMKAAWDKRDSVIAEIQKKFKIEHYQDSTPKLDSGDRL